MRHGYAAVAAPVLAAAATTAQQPEKLPIWAYPGHFSSTPVTGTEVEHLPGSKASYTRAEINQIFVVPDWYPDGHPPMPEVVAHGRKPDVYSCGHCHLPNGQGRPENASVAGLPAAYFIAQIADFKNGLRTDPEMPNVATMAKLSKAMSDEDVKAAAAYFSSIKPKPWIR